MRRIQLEHGRGRVVFVPGRQPEKDALRIGDITLREFCGKFGEDRSDCAVEIEDNFREFLARSYFVPREDARILFFQQFVAPPCPEKSRKPYVVPFPAET